MTDEFNNICNNESKLFNAIVEALELPRRVNKEETKRLLAFVDNVVDYYLQLPAAEGIRYPIIYIPCAKDWVEEVCLEFVSYKIESMFDKEIMSNLKGYLQTVINAAGRGLDEVGQKQYIKEERKWRNKIRPIVLASDNCTNIRNLIVCGQGIYRRLLSKRLLMRFLADSPKTSITHSNLLSVEEKFSDYKDFANIFCFYSNNGCCNDYTSNSLNNWNELRNCFVFEFGKTPYSLKNILKWGKKLCKLYTDKYLLSQDDTQSRYQDFITLTNEETHYLFNELPQDGHKIISYPEEIRSDLEYIVEFYKGNEEFRFSINDRNILSLCLCQESINAYLEYLRKEKPEIFQDQCWESVLEMILRHLPKDIIIDTILNFACPNTEAAFVICNAPESIKKTIKKKFEDKGLHIKFYKFDDLKEQTIKDDKIVVLRFCPHNLSTRDYSPKYPNSFDEFSLKPGQEIIDIINEIAFIDYQKYHYDYELRLCAVTNSQYRRDILGGAIPIPPRPQVQLISHYEDSDDDAYERTQANNIPSIKFMFSDGTYRSLPENELLICCSPDGDYYIDNIRTLRESGCLNNQLKIQPISELADSAIDIFFTNTNTINTITENTLRENYIRKGIIPQNHNHEVPVWKFLLEKKIRDYCVQNNLIEDNNDIQLWQLLRDKLDNKILQELYQQMAVKVQIERVIKEWCDINKVEPLAPGIKKDRKSLLINFLELNQSISALYHKKQLLIKNNTKKRNKITEGFLSRILFNDITDDMALELLEDPLYADSLAIESKDDIEALKKIALENINLKQIKSYSL